MNRVLFRSQVSFFEFNANLTSPTEESVPVGCLLMGHVVDTHVASLVYFHQPEVFFRPSDIITQALLNGLPEIVRIRIQQIWSDIKSDDSNIEVIMEEMASMFRGSLYMARLNAPEEKWVEGGSSAICLAENLVRDSIHWWPHPSKAGPVYTLLWDSKGNRRLATRDPA